MLTFVEAIRRSNTITIDGYTSNKTDRGIIADVARAVEKYSVTEAEALRSYLKDEIDEFNHPFIKASNSEGGYFFEVEDHEWRRYFCIRIIVDDEPEEETETTDDPEDLQKFLESFENHYERLYTSADDTEETAQVKRSGHFRKLKRTKLKSWNVRQSQPDR